MTESKYVTKEEVRRIAKEEASKMNKELVARIEKLEESIHNNTVILQRIDRLLLGEVGVNEEDTLKARANFAYLYAKRNSDAKIIDRAMPAIKWFEDMTEVEPGCKESKLETLGRIIGLFGKVEFLLTLFGVTTLVNLIPTVKAIIELINNIN